MKAVRSVAWLLFLAAFVASQTAPSLGTSCPNSNPFIVSLNKDVNLYTTPTKASFICGFEFSTYGSCCNPYQLGPYARNEAKYLQRDVERLNLEYKKFKDVIQELYKTWKRIALAPLHPTRQDWNQKIQLARKLFDDPHVRQYFKQQLSIDTLSVKKFEEQNNACWAVHSKARDLALCFACSGRSNHFFRNGKALISQKACDAFVDQCASPLSVLVQFVSSLEFLPTIDAKLQEFDLYLNIDAKLKRTELKKYFETFRNENIEQLILTANTYIGEDIQAEMCSKFFRLKETPIISQMRPMFSSDGPWLIQLWDIKSHLNKNAAQIDANERAYDAQTASAGSAPSTSNWHPARRMLRMLQFSSSFLQSDASIISPSDPSYSSVGVSGSSPMDFGQSFP